MIIFILVNAYPGYCVKLRGHCYGLGESWRCLKPGFEQWRWREAFHLLGIVEVGMMGLADGVVMKCKKESTPGWYGSHHDCLSDIHSSIFHMSEPWFVQGSSVPSQKAVFPSSSGNWGGLETQFWTMRNKQKLVGNIWSILLFPHRFYAFYLVNSFLFLPLECGCEAGGRAAILQPWGECRKKILLSLRGHCTALVCLPLVLSLCEKNNCSLVKFESVTCRQTQSNV